MAGRPKGTPKTGGRKRGAANKKTREIADKAAESGQTPLEYMLDIMRSPMPIELEKALKDRRKALTPEIVAQVVGWYNMRFEAAKAAAPYMHPRLQTTTVEGNRDDSSIPASIDIRFVR